MNLFEKLYRVAQFTDELLHKVTTAVLPKVSARN